MEIISVKLPSEEEVINAAAIAKTSYHEETYEYWKEKLDYEAAKKFLLKVITGNRPSDRHESVLESLVFTFNVTDVSRVLTHQLVRHRMASYLQKSLRKQRKFDVTTFVYPKKSVNLDKYEKAVKALTNLYEELIKLGENADDARRILPIGIATEITMTMNGRALRGFLKQRLAKAANWEIRELATRITSELIINDLGYLVEDIIKDYNEGKL